MKMGGEQFAVLMYGPPKSYDTIRLITNVFKVFDMRAWVEKNVKDEEDPGPYTDMDIEEIFYNNYQMSDFDGFDILLSFLDSVGMTYAFTNNLEWERPHLGALVNSYDTFSEDDKHKVNTFCEKYKLGKPTFYAGVQGEFE